MHLRYEILQLRDDTLLHNLIDLLEVRSLAVQLLHMFHTIRDLLLKISNLVSLPFLHFLQTSKLLNPLLLMLTDNSEQV